MYNNLHENFNTITISFTGHIRLVLYQSVNLSKFDLEWKNLAEWVQDNTN
jgi:hypothetical protein